MSEAGDNRRNGRDALRDRETWFGQQLGDEWTEVEPGIYRLCNGELSEVGLRLAHENEPGSQRGAGADK